MHVTSITVKIHEKRNHPHEYGHFDAETGYTIALDPGDDPLAVEAEWRARAYAAVQAQCDNWIAGIEETRQQQRARSNLDGSLYWAIRQEWDEGNQRAWDKYLALLPEAERAEWNQKLDRARAHYTERKREPKPAEPELDDDDLYDDEDLDI
jgi:hypothetical protein